MAKEQILIYYCPNCNSTYSDKEGKTNPCPKCGQFLMQTPVLVDDWRSYSQAQKDSLKQGFAEKTKRISEQLEATVKDMLLTTGNTFQGYKILKYVDVYFDEIVFGLGFAKGIAASFENIGAAFSGGEATVATDRLNEIKSLLKKRMMQKAAENGANALLGIDFESSGIGDLMMVSMTATAVVIEPITDSNVE